MNCFSSIIFALVIATDMASAQEAKPSALEAEVRAIMEGYDDSVRANTLKLIAAKTEQERATFRASVPAVGSAAQRVLAFISAHRDDPAAIVGLNWVIERAANTTEGDAALNLLGTQFLTQTGMAPAVKSLQYQAAAKVEATLLAIREKNTHRQERASATYALAVQQFQKFESAIDSSATNEGKTRAMELFSEVTGPYADVVVDNMKLSESAAQMLFELANLTEGCTAPDIEGSDSEGVKFNLKDYRGQPVVVVFWSDGCHACHDLMPMIAQQVTAAAAKRVVLLGVSGDTAEGAKASMASHHFSLRTWADGSTGGSIQRLYNIRRYPTIYLLDAAGGIRYKGSAVAPLAERMKQLP